MSVDLIILTAAIVCAVITLTVFIIVFRVFWKMVNDYEDATEENPDADNHNLHL